MKKQVLVELVMVAVIEEPIKPIMVELRLADTDDVEMLSSGCHPPLPATERENRQY
jgi:hypothetical protein